MRLATTFIILAAAAGTGCESMRFSRRATVQAPAEAGELADPNGYPPEGEPPPGAPGCLPPDAAGQPGVAPRPARRPLLRGRANPCPPACPPQCPPACPPQPGVCQPPPPAETPVNRDAPRQPRPAERTPGPNDELIETRSAASAAVTQDVMLVPRTVYVPYVPHVPVAPAMLRGVVPAGRVVETEERTQRRAVVAREDRDPEPARRDADRQARDAVLDDCRDEMKRLRQKIDELEGRAARTAVPAPAPCPPVVQYAPAPSLGVPCPAPGYPLAYPPVYAPAAGPQPLPPPTPLPTIALPAMPPPVPPK